jgi:sugar-specific transcriptional regulator TrmB
MSIKRGLITVGLTNLESEVYIELLKLKQAKASELAEVTKITRTQLYPLLERLVEKGVIKKIDNKVVIYKAIEPDEFISLLNKWKKDKDRILKGLVKEIRKIK